MKGHISYFDQHTYSFTCENPQCGKPFNEVLGRLLKAKEVSCPNCGTTINIRESKTSGPIGKAFDTASELDKQAMKKK